jgi:serine/threonine protein phosphatase PrpC
MLGDREIGALLGSDKNPDRVCNKLVTAANKAGGKDNIAVVLVVF